MNPSLIKVSIIKKPKLIHVRPYVDQNLDTSNHSKPFHTREISANIPYESIHQLSETRIGKKNATSRTECCPIPSGDIDDVPSPPKYLKNKTPGSNETKETYNGRCERNTSLGSEGECTGDSLGFLECNENLCDVNISMDSSSVCNIPVEKIIIGSQSEENEDNSGLGIDTLNYLIQREPKFTPDPYYIEKYDPEITPKMPSFFLKFFFFLFHSFNVMCSLMAPYT